MDKGGEFELLPFELSWCGNHVRGKFYLLIGGEQSRECQFFFEIGVGSLVASGGEYHHRNQATMHKSPYLLLVACCHTF